MIYSWHLDKGHKGALEVIFKFLGIYIYMQKQVNYKQHKDKIVLNFITTGVME